MSLRIIVNVFLLLFINSVYGQNQAKLVLEQNKMIGSCENQYYTGFEIELDTSYSAIDSAQLFSQFPRIGKVNFKNKIDIPTEFTLTERAGFPQILFRFKSDYLTFDNLSIEPQSISFTIDNDPVVPVTTNDLKIIRLAKSLLSEEKYWNKEDDRSCDDDLANNSYSLYCALRISSLQITEYYNHRNAVLQKLRHLIDEKHPNEKWNHRLMDFNNMETIKFEDISNVLNEIEQYFINELEKKNESYMNEESNAQKDLPIINSLWNFSDPKETEEKFRELIPKAKEQNDQSYYAELLTQLARTQSLQRNFDQAHEILDSAQAIISNDMAVPKVRYHLERGRSFNSAAKKKEASEQFKLAFDLALENKQEYYAVDAAHMLGISEEPVEQLGWNLKAMEVAEKSEDKKTRSWLGPLYNNIGWTYHDLNQFEKALELFNKSLAWRQEQNDKKGTFIAHWTIGRVYRSLGRIEDALEVQQTLLKEKEKDNSDPSGYEYEEIGECLLIKKEPEKAKAYFKQAYEILSKDGWLQDNEKERLNRMLELSQ